MIGKVSIGKKCPDFKKVAVVNGDFKTVSLGDYKGKYLILLFYPLDITFVCPTEILAFSSAAAEFRKQGAEILAISCDSQFSHLAWTKIEPKKGGLGNINIPLVADFDKSMGSDFGILNEEGVTYRGLFIIDPKQVVRQVTVK
jgi:alkyl hydroperoxide reductase subunit AhpC